MSLEIINSPFSANYYFWYHCSNHKLWVDFTCPAELTSSFSAGHLKCFLSSYTFPNLEIQWCFLVGLPENSPDAFWCSRLKAGSVFTIVWHPLDLSLCVNSCHITMLSSCISIYMKLALSFGQNKGKLSLCNLCLPYGSLQWTRTIVYSILPQSVGLLRQGPRLHLSEGPKQCPLHRLNRRVHSRGFCFLPRFPHPLVLSLNPLSFIKGQDPEYQPRRIYIVLDWHINIKMKFLFLISNILWLYPSKDFPPRKGWGGRRTSSSNVNSGYGYNMWKGVDISVSCSVVSDSLWPRGL